MVSHALYYLAEQPSLVQALRDEIEANTGVDGWTTGMANMWKLDSLLREIIRHHGTALGT